MTTATDDRCEVDGCNGSIRRTYRAAEDGDVEPAAYCAGCGQLVY